MIERVIAPPQAPKLISMANRDGIRAAQENAHMQWRQTATINHVTR